MLNINNTIQERIESNLTILVCSCDAYKDLWIPFFKLLKKYSGDYKLNILLNTESSEFQYGNLQIKNVHPTTNDCPYGQRMIEALNKVRTEYVLLLLDDFFISQPIDFEHIAKVIAWMDSDRNIVCFNQDTLKTEFIWENEKYEHYKRVPRGTPYTLNMQAGIWRTKKLLSYWKPNVSPWEWELYSNCITYSKNKDKFYCMKDADYTFCYYGEKKEGDLFGVFRGKWVREHVIPLFEKENIQMDYSKRGFYDENKVGRVLLEEIPAFSRIRNCIGIKCAIRYKLFTFMHGNFLHSCGASIFDSYLNKLAYSAFKIDVFKRRIDIVLNKMKQDGICNTIIMIKEKL